MSVTVMGEVWKRTDLDPYERLVMLSLADHADDEGSCYPSIARLCARTGMKERGVQVVLKRLAAKGFVSVRIGEGRKGSNVYTVHPTPAPDAPRTGCTPQDMHPAPGAETPAPHVAEPPHGVHPNLQGTIKETSGGARGARPARQKAERLSPEWLLPKLWGDWAVSQGMTAETARREAEKFRNYWVAKSKDATKLDWEATWRNWVLKALEDQPHRPGGAPVQSLDSQRAKWRDIAGDRRTA